MSAGHAPRPRQPEDELLERARVLVADRQVLGLFERLRDFVAGMRRVVTAAEADEGFRTIAKSVAAAVQGGVHGAGQVVPISAADRRAMQELVRVTLEVSGATLDGVSHEVVVDQDGASTVLVRVADPDEPNVEPLQFKSTVGPEDVKRAAREISRRGRAVDRGEASR